MLASQELTVNALLLFSFGHVLRYKVWPKTKKAIAQIVELVKRYPDESGSQRVNACELAAFSQASRHCVPWQALCTAARVVTLRRWLTRYGRHLRKPGCPSRSRTTMLALKTL